MKVILFGASGMVGQGVLRECLLDPAVTQILTVGRRADAPPDPKLTQIVHRDFFDFADIEPQLSGYDACFFCLGVSSGFMREQEYAHLTYDLTLAAARTLSHVNPGMTFVYVSGSGTDSTEQSRSMWARVKGRTENALLKLPFKAAYMLRPGAIQPLHGVRSKTALYQAIYSVTRPLLPPLRALFPGQITTTEHLGRVMIALARDGYPKPILEARDITALNP
ncbi:epimerase [Burkholderia sp. L27(2015)]|uniref:epimerase n=1 Tax=Burkholderia sp. L27(2015) TaxID=1641858 RepID=UPI00131B7D1D|nr:epimerase [Burkholderia sp. L27(2015)]